jgi:hypothetical protein
MTLQEKVNNINNIVFQRCRNSAFDPMAVTISKWLKALANEDPELKAAMEIGKIQQFCYSDYDIPHFELIAE